MVLRTERWNWIKLSEVLKLPVSLKINFKFSDQGDWPLYIVQTKRFLKFHLKEQEMLKIKIVSVRLWRNIVRSRVTVSNCLLLKQLPPPILLLWTFESSHILAAGSFGCFLSSFLGENNSLRKSGLLWLFIAQPSKSLFGSEEGSPDFNWNNSLCSLDFYLGIDYVS